MTVTEQETRDEERLAVPELVIETRSGEGFEVAEVNFPNRLVTVVAMPYERPTSRASHGGRLITEVVSAGRSRGSSAGPGRSAPTATTHATGSSARSSLCTRHARKASSPR